MLHVADWHIATSPSGREVVDGKSSTASERTAPTRAYFFFFAATLRLAGAFFFAAVFAFVAFFTMMPS
jgi:hypothetical protein